MENCHPQNINKANSARIKDGVAMENNRGLLGYPGPNDKEIYNLTKSTKKVKVQNDDLPKEREEICRTEESME